MFLLVNLTKVSTAAHSMYFPKSQFQLGSPLILVTAPELTGFFYSYFQGSWKIEAFSLCMFLLLPNLREVPHGMKGTSPKFVMRPAYLRSQLRNNTNTVSALVHLIHLLHVFCTWYTGIAHHWVLQTSGEVGLTPRQYTEWNVAGRARSTGDPSQ